jgi:hypothetical protein
MPTIDIGTWIGERIECHQRENRSQTRTKTGIFRSEHPAGHSLAEGQ